MLRHGCRYSVLHEPEFQGLLVSSTVGATVLLAGLTLTVVTVRRDEVGPAIRLASVFD